jgi:hypothetical protein
MKQFHFTVALFLLLVVPRGVHAQESMESNKLEEWIALQSIPSLTWYSGPSQSAFGFEWGVTPLLYSFGINHEVSPWYTFIVEPPARFSGSVELRVAGQVFTSKVGRSYFGLSGHLMGYIPLIERGEHLTLNLGIGTYRVGEERPVFGVVGVSTLFGFVHLNLKHSLRPSIWITSLEFRFF